MLHTRWWLGILMLSSNTLIKCEPNWTYDMISVEVVNKSPHIATLQAEITRPTRGVFALSGIIDLKVDITDELFLEEATFYSQTGSNYVRTPFAMPKANFSSVMNSYYKDYIMDSIVNCTENAVLIVDKFVAPLTKRVIRLKDCIISNERFPPILRSGYYKIVFRYSNFAEGSLECLIKVEQK